MFYTYVLRSTKDHKLYTGATDDLRKRFAEHAKGMVRSTKGRGPFQIVYYEACLNKSDAFHREKYLKSGYGKRYVKNRLKRFLSLTGFTFIELMVVIGVMATLVAVAMPSYFMMKKNMSLKTEADQTIIALRTAQNKAISSVNGKNHGIYFCCNGTLYCGFNNYEGDTPVTDCTNPSHKYSANIKIVAPPIDIMFMRLLGTAAQKDITLVYPDGTTKIIKLEANGRISAQ